MTSGVATKATVSGLKKSRSHLWHVERPIASTPSLALKLFHRGVRSIPSFSCPMETSLPIPMVLHAMFFLHKFQVEQMGTNETRSVQRYEWKRRQSAHAVLHGVQERDERCTYLVQVLCRIQERSCKTSDK